MSDRLIAFALKQRALVVVLALVVALAGAFAFLKLPIDAFPDVTNVQVQVISDAPGLAPEEVERLVTFPLEIELNGLPKVAQVRSISKFGLSVITVVFDDGTDIYFARQQINERLGAAKAELPPGVSSNMGPIATGMGEIYQYSIEGPLSLEEKRKLQDWTIRPMLRTVPGVTEVNALGGELKQYPVEVRPERLLAYNLTTQDVIRALSANNLNAAGNFFNRGDEQFLVRGVGLLRTPDELNDLVVAVKNGQRVTVRDVATVGTGGAPRQGAATRNGEETVIGIVMKLKGENSRAVIQAVEAKLHEASQALPKGARIVPFYDQGQLVEKAVGTVEKSLLEGGVLVVAVLVFFLWNLPSSLIVALTIPLALLFAFALMRLTGLPGNLMSLGGLAIGLGMMVDAAIVMVENIYRHLAEEDREVSLPEVVFRAAHEVGRPIVFAIGIIIAVFLPLFTLQGLEGKMFSPMAFTIAFALVGSLIASLTLVPVLATFWLKVGAAEHGNPLLAKLQDAYNRALAFVLARGKAAVGLAAGALVASLALVPLLGTEFLPSMDEGSAVISANRLPSISLEKANAQSRAVEKTLLRFPEVISVVTRTGRAEVASDPMDVSTSDIFLQLKPREEWKTATTKEALVERFAEAAGRVPGIGLSFGEPIAVRVDEMISGVKSNLAIKLFGEDLEVLAERGEQIRAELARVPGAADVRMEQLAGLRQVAIQYDRAQVARYGLSAEDLGALIEAAVGGHVATELQEGRRRVGVSVRLPASYRDDLDKLAKLPVPLPVGGQVPLGAVARISLVSGPAVVSHENGLRRVVIECNVRGRDLGGFVAEAQGRLSRAVALPAGYYLEWGGQFENQQRAMKTLGIVVPLVIAVIFGLLYASFGSFKQAILVLLNVPFAMIGGIVALALSQQRLSVSASVGFIALFGVAVQNGVILLTTINKLRSQGASVEASVREGASMRLRPVLMTALVASLGLVPLALSNGIGSEIQRPLAWVVIGGLVSSTALTLFLLPVLYRWTHRDRESLDVQRPDEITASVPSMEVG